MTKIKMNTATYKYFRSTNIKKDINSIYKVLWEKRK